MTSSPEAAALNLQAALTSSESVRAAKPRLLLWATLCALTLLLFSVASLPRMEAQEPSLNSISLLGLLNQDRQANGLLPLADNRQLQNAALAKADDILRNNYFAHTSPTGIKPWDFIKKQGFAYNFAGENLAINYTSATDLEHDFLQSPSHRANLLSPLFSEIGIAVVSGLSASGRPTVVTVQMFASPATAQPVTANRLAQK